MDKGTMTLTEEPQYRPVKKPTTLKETQDWHDLDTLVITLEDFRKSLAQAQTKAVEAELRKVWEMSQAIYFTPPTSIEENKVNGRKLQEINQYCAKRLTPPETKE